MRLVCCRVQKIGQLQIQNHCSNGILNTLTGCLAVKTATKNMPQKIIMVPGSMSSQLTLPYLPVINKKQRNWRKKVKKESTARSQKKVKCPWNWKGQMHLDTARLICAHGLTWRGSPKRRELTYGIIKILKKQAYSLH